MDADAVMLSDLATAAADHHPRLVGPDVAVADLHHDSRSVATGDGFVAIPGASVDGHDFVDGAIACGAAAVVVEHEMAVDVPQLVVSDTRRALPMLAATVHGLPSKELTVVGITGTNGKTTVAHMVEAIATAARRKAGVVGTVGGRIGGEPIPLSRTTPEATDLQRLLRRMVDAGVDVVALEVSSHALVLGRADAVDFDVVAFTNLSQDHLDFHGSMEHYAAAKLRLFDPARARRAVVWIDDPVGADIAALTALDVTSVGRHANADVRGRVLGLTGSGSVIEVTSAWGSARIELPLAGGFNADNALVAVACALEIGIGLTEISEGLGRLGVVPGRFERVDRGQDFTVVVDYAHTPDAVAAMVTSAGELTRGKVIVVVGAGGDRDAAKRPAMGAAAATADVAVITSDNPRSEDPAAIIDAVVGGVPGDRAVRVEPDRAKAIAVAIAQARAGDIVLILGKGHEQGQEAAGVVVPFDDRLAAAAALEQEVTA